MKITIEGNTVDGSARSTLNVVLSGARGPAGEPSPLGVPYTGATQDVNLGEFGLLTGNIEFDTTPTNAPTGAGSMSWNDTDGTVNLVLKGGNVISKLGETQHIRAYNNTGTTIARGKVVYVSGAQGQRLTVALADADTEILSKDTIGFTAESIADGAEGFVIIAGVLSNMNTSGMSDGATVYLSQTLGGYTTTPPVDPAHLVILGFIVNGGSGGAGSIYVKVDNGYELEELHGVADAAKVTPVAADALLLRDSADNNLWKRLTWTNALAGVKTYMDTFKGVAGGYASLDGSGKIPSSELPSYVDDVIEAANFAALPVTGETGKIYVTLDTNKCYRWSGSAYIEISAGGGIDTLTTTGTSGAATLVGSTLNIPQYQSVLTNPVTGTGTSGQVAYWSGTTTQTGSNNLFWDAANGRLGIGTNTPDFTFSILNTSAESSNRGIGITNISSDASGASSVWRKARGTVASPSATQNNDVLGFFGFRGYGTSWFSQSSVFIQASAEENFSATNAGGRIEFGTITNGFTTNSVKMQLKNNGNLILQTGGTFTDNGQRLQVYGSTLLRGSGTTSATTALLVQNSTPTELFKVLDNGAWNHNGDGVITGGGTGATNILVLRNSNNENILSIRNDKVILLPSNLALFTNRTSVGLGIDFTLGFLNRTTGIQVYTGGTTTSGTYNAFHLEGPFSPTSGTASFNNILINPTINQTGGANGITRGLYVNPTLTAAADWRGIESVAASNANHTLLKLRNATVDVFTVKSDSKIGFFNATPIAQPTTGIAEAAFVENSGGTAVNVDSTFAGYTIQQIAQALKDIGLLA